MFGLRKKARSERSFSMMLAEEVFRAELKKIYGVEIKIFQCDMEAINPRSVACESVSEQEARWAEYAQCHKERFIRIDAVVGPFERAFPDNPPEDKRRNIRKVSALCRLFSTESGCTFWKPHFLILRMFAHWGEVELAGMRGFNYSGCGSIKVANPVWDCADKWEQAVNPCEDMCVSQIQPDYSRISQSNRGTD